MSRVWKPTGDFVRFKSSGTGYFKDAYELTGPMDDSNVQAGMGIGMVNFSIKDGGDDAAQGLIRALRQGRREVQVMYREWKQESEGGTATWENLRCVAICGYISMARLQSGASSMSIEVHTIKDTSISDLGIQKFSVDCVNGDKAFGDQDLGKRQPEHLDPPGTPESSDWGELLNS